jgi:hypothetical protein
LRMLCVNLKGRPLVMCGCDSDYRDDELMYSMYYIVHP